MFTSDNDVIIPAPLTRANDGVKSEDVNVTIPKSIVYNPQDEVKTVVDLAKFVNHVAVKTAVANNEFTWDDYVHTHVAFV